MGGRERERKREKKLQDKAEKRELEERKGLKALPPITSSQRYNINVGIYLSLCSLNDCTFRPEIATRRVHYITLK